VYVIISTCGLVHSPH